MAIATRPKPKLHHRKRQAGHHRHSKPYLKTYWPYLPMAAIVGLGMFVNSLWATGSVLGASSNFSPDSLLADTNTQRSENQEQALRISQQLASAAQAKANDMAAKNYWSHTSPDGKTPWTFITATGYQYQSAGENLAYGFANADGVVAGWMNSTEHRANILDKNYQEVGFGIAESQNYQGKGPEVIVVAEYAQPVAAAANISFDVANTSQNSPASVKGDQLTLSAQPISRVQVLTGASWATIATAALAGAAAAIFVLRHGLWLKRLIKEGESVFIHHPLLDIAITLVATAGFVLTRTTGLIG